MAFGWDDAVLGALLIGNYVYHRFFDTPPAPPPAPELTLPRVDDGAPYPVFFGRCRIKNAVIAYTTRPIAFYHTDGDALDRVALGPEGTPLMLYFVNMMLVLGIPFQDGVQSVRAMWMGDEILQGGSITPLWQLQGVESDYGVRHCDLFSSQSPAKGSVEFFNGNAAQELVQNVGPYTPRSEAGLHMTQTTGGGDTWTNPTGTIDPTLVPGYRGLVSVFLYGRELQPDSGETLLYWLIGQDPSIAQFSFETQSLPANPLGPANYVPVMDGDIAVDQGDANPADVILEVLTGTKGKLGIPLSRIHLASFTAAATTLYNEGNGFSFAFTSGQTAKDIIDSVLRQIDGVLYEDPVDGLVHLRLIRNDYDPNTIPHINQSNCVTLMNFAAGGWTDIPNKVRISFSNRADNYNPGSGVAHNQANALGQDGQVRERQVQMPAVTTQANADSIAARELSATSRPLVKCRAIVSRALRNLVPGDVIMLTWGKWKLNNVVMRVAAVNRGTVGANSVALDLIQDYYYVWRGRPPVAGGARALRTAVGMTH